MVRASAGRPQPWWRPRRDRVRDQPSIAGPVLADDGHRLGDLRAGGEGRLDLAGFDAEAAELDLAVGTAVELQLAVGRHARVVAGAVHTGAGRAVRVGDEAFGGRARAAQVAAGHAGTGDVQLPHRARRERLQGRVEDVRPHAVQGAADRQRVGNRGVRRARAGGGKGGDLGRAVAVGDGQSRAGCQDSAHGVGGDSLTAGPHLAQPPETARVLLRGEAEQAGGQPQCGQSVTCRQPCHGGGVHVLVRPGDHRGAAVEQRHPHLVGGGVEGGRRVHQHARVRAVAEGRVGGQGGDVAVGDCDALGDAGGAGGVADVGELGRAQSHGGVRVRRGGERRIVGTDDHRAVVGLGGHGVGEQHVRAGLGQDVPGAGGRCARVESDVGAAGLEYSQECGEEAVGAARQDRDAILRPDTEGDQPVREAVGAGFQLPVGRGPFTLDDRGGVRGGRDPGRKQLGDGRCHPGRRVAGELRSRPLLRQRHLDPSDRGTGDDSRGEVLHEARETPVMGGEFAVLVVAGTGVEVDADTVAVRAVVDVDGEVLDGPCGQVVASGGMPGEPQLRPERHDVDDGPEEAPPALRPVQFAAQVLAPVALVRQQVPGGGGRLAYEVGGGRVGPYGQP